MYKNFDVPNKCKECNFIAYYDEGPWIRNPHCCCELRFALYDEDYKVDPEKLDENCPLINLGGRKNNVEVEE